MVDAANRGAAKDAAVRVEVDARDADIGHPSLGVERDVAGVAEDDDAVKPMGGSGISPLPAMWAKAVVDNEMSAFDADLDAVAVNDTDAGG